MSAEPVAIYTWRLYGPERGRAVIDADPNLARQAIDRVLAEGSAMLSHEHLELVSNYIDCCLLNSNGTVDSLVPLDHSTEVM